MNWHRYDTVRGVLTLELQIQPSASKTAVAGAHGERLRIRLAAPPVDGRANELLIDFLRMTFSVPQRQVKIVRGAASRRKTVEIELPAASVAPVIQAWALLA